MSAHVLLNLLNKLGKEIKCEACGAFNLFFATSLINSIIQEHKVDSVYHRTLQSLFFLHEQVKILPLLM